LLSLTQICSPTAQAKAASAQVQRWKWKMAMYDSNVELFPQMPKHNYRQAQKLVKEFCQETGIKYTNYGFVERN
jgi:fatty acid desaturase